MNITAVKYMKGRNHLEGIRRCIRKCPDWPPGARTENGISLCH